MKKITLKFVLLSFFVLSFTFAFSQANTKFEFQGKVVEMPRNIESFKWNQMPSNASYGANYYGCIKFLKTPTQQIQNEFKTRGLQLDYVSENTYFFNFSTSVDVSYLKSVGVISIIPMPLNFKMSSKIRNNEIGEWAKDGDNILVYLQYHKNVSENVLVSQLTQISGVFIKEQFKGSDILSLSIHKNSVDKVAKLPIVKWIELVQEPGVKEDIRGKSIHRSSNLDTQTISGRNYTGKGIGVMVRDDGIVGPHIDFHGRIDNTGASGTGATHGDGVAGIMAGAGNLDPTKRGMAAESDLYIVNYVSNHLDPPTTTLLNDGSVQITNSSYSDGCNVGYTINSRTVDSQINSNLSLLHVFSAGNSNNNNCGYGAGDQWGNITGGHKQGKNVIATANVFFNGGLVNSSSRGPAHDGRIKPDITAHGQGQLSTDENNDYLTFGGTSGAAPGIAGVSAQLYQLYKEQNSDQLPESALIKATLLNTANDYGNVGPDFKFGWGIVNGLRAAMLLEDGRYLDDNISQGNENNHTINVPANTKQVRFMVYWNDPAAVSGVSTALVNDLDLKVTSPSSTELLPWVLDHTPNVTTLDLPATNGIDRLNNMEQVLINNPESGDYTINITGFNIPSGPQHYYVVYEVITEELTLTYPVGNEKLVVGEQETIHWDAINTTNDFLLEYSTNNGSSWSTIATVPSSSTNYTWVVPSDVSGECLIRITSGTFTDVSDAVFSIANLVTGVDISQICPDNLTVVWNSIPDATSYDVYLLGDKFMDKIGTTSDVSYSISITDPNVSFWVAVAASGGMDNWETRRSLAINRSGGLYNCSLNKDLTVESLVNDFTALNLLCGSDNSVEISANIRNLGIDNQSNFLISYQLDSNPVVEETYTGTINSGSQEIYTFTTPLEITVDGNHTLSVWVTLTGDEFVGNNEHQEMFYAQVIAETINNVQTFETVGFPPSGWKIDNIDSSTTWVSETITGSDGQPTTAAAIDNFSYNAAGQEDIFTTLVYDLSGSNMVLNFDIAKAQYSASFSDEFRVDISTDCGATYTNIYDKNGLDLSTLSNYTTADWSPTSASDWRTENIDLTAYLGQNVQIRFVNVCGYGNGTFIDNIDITGTLSTSQESFDDNFSLYPNPVENRFTIRSKKVGLKKVVIYNLSGREITTVNIRGNQQIINISTDDLASGVYLVRLESELGIFHKKIIKN